MVAWGILGGSCLICDGKSQARWLGFETDGPNGEKDVRVSDARVRPGGAIVDGEVEPRSRRIPEVEGCVYCYD